MKTCKKHLCHAFGKCAYKHDLDKCRICRQGDLCSYWQECPYKRDFEKCRQAGANLDGAEDDLNL